MHTTTDIDPRATTPSPVEQTHASHDSGHHAAAVPEACRRYGPRSATVREYSVPAVHELELPPVENAGDDTW